MIRWLRGTVVETECWQEDVICCQVRVDGQVRLALNYDQLTGEVQTGDEVVVNATAVDLDLGTGGYDFVACNLTRPQANTILPGHIMKLRYTPWQLCCKTVEAEDGIAHEVMEQARDLQGMPVVICGLHSQLPAVAAGIKVLAPKVKVGYVMTDAGALPAWWSRTVGELKASGLLSCVITCGHAFGGDMETINVYTGMLAARHVAECDVVIVGPGPGHVGSGTLFGFTGVEQGQHVDVVNALYGRPVGVLRISFADQRDRHQGVSHHSLTALGLAAHTAADIGVCRDQENVVRKQIASAPGMGKHRLWVVDGSCAIAGMEQLGLTVTTMGRSVADDPAFFRAAGAGARVAVNLMGKRVRHDER